MLNPRGTDPAALVAGSIWRLAPAAVAAVIACAALAGAITGSTVLQGYSGSLQSMVPSNAAGVVLAAAALALAQTRRWPVIAQALAAVVLLLGLVGLAQYLLDRDLGLDGLLGPGVTIGEGNPGRMAANSAVCLVLGGASLLSLDRRFRGIRPADAGALLIALITGLTLLGYLFDVPELQRGGGSSLRSPMALPTATAMLLISAGLLIARPNAGLAALARGRGPGGALVRRLVPAAIAVPVVIAVLLLAGDFGIEEGLALYCATLVAIFCGLVLVTGRALERSDSARRAGAARERAIIAATVDAVVTMDDHGRVTEFNPAAERMFGHAREAAIGQELAALLVPAALREAHRIGLARCVATGESRILGRPVELTAMRADGSEFPIELTVSRLAGAGAATFVGHARDITEQQERQAAIQRLATIVESSPDAIITFSDDGTVDVWNAAAERMYGYAAPEIVGHSLSMLADPDDRSHPLEQLLRALARGETIVSEGAAVRKDGRRIDVFFTAFGILDAQGAIVSGGLISRDVTERRKLEDQLRQAQKMEAVGQLAGGIAHDFNNLLTVITGYGDLARAIVGDGSGAEELAEIDRAARRAAALTNQLLAFSRRQMLDPVQLDLSLLAHDVVPMLRRLIGDDIDVVAQLAPNLPSVLADAGQLEQALINLAVNARDAMPEGGTLTIETRALVLDEEGGPVRYVCLTVSDTGTGIERSAQPHIFEPFYTTKEVGKGTGLGLASVHGAITQSGGQVQVYSEPGSGTAIKIFLPATGAPSTRPPGAPDPQDWSGGDETILICEDEQGVRSLLERTLRGGGYRILTADRPMAALAVAAAEPGHIDGLVSDVIMPDMPGPELARMLQDLRPGLRTLFISGYTADTVHGRGSLPAGSAFLEKPFDRATLLRTLRALLDRVR